MNAGREPSTPMGPVTEGVPPVPPAPDRPVAASGRATLKVLVIVATMTLLTPFTIDMYLPAFPQMEADLNASSWQIQLSLTGMMIGLASGQLVVGPLADAFGRRKPVLVGLLCHVGASLLCFVATEPFVLAACRLLQGLACAAVTVVSMATVRDLFAGAAHARVMSRMFLIIGIGPVIAPSVGAGVLAFADWPVIFLALAAIAVLLLAVAFAFFPETLPPDRRTRAEFGAALTSYASLLRDPTYAATALVGGLMLSTVFSYISGATFLFQDKFGLSEQQFALLFAANSVSLVLVAQINPVLIRRLGVAQVLTGATVTGLVSSTMLLLTLTVFDAPLVWVAVALGACVASYGISTPNSQGLALARQGHRAGSAAALMGFVQFAIGAIVAPVVGLGGANGIVMASVMIGASACAALLMLLVVRRHAANMEMR